jgi:plasmid stabilization system protein ParE
MAHRRAPQADLGLVDSITDRFLLLGSHPFIGRTRDEDLRPDLRSFPVGEYIILYRIER